MHQHEKSGLQATGSINLITEQKGILVTARADPAIASQQCEATLHAATVKTKASSAQVPAGLLSAQ